MTVLIINPGTGPLEETSLKNAEAAFELFMGDLNTGEMRGYRNPGKDDQNGRYGFTIMLEDRRVDIQMPGIDPEVTRKSKPWESPRLYVDGSSWLWEFALGAAREILETEKEPA